ncbi:hypothetical protein KUCAC02_016436 [Chaenocephalus aceratus]|nr:hypothetical protein KUCAC02_016436 [Chaenocephalus aceratus]
MVHFFFGNSLGRSQQTAFRKCFEWEAVRLEVENICKEESFICPACTPNMLAVSVDGNLKHAARIAVTTKHMTTAGRTDMLTLMAMRWNQQPFRNVATSLWHRYQKTTKALRTSCSTWRP